MSHESVTAIFFLLSLIGIFWIAPACLCGEIFQRRGRSFWAGFWVSMIVSPLIGIVVALCLSTDHEALRRKRESDIEGARERISDYMEKHPDYAPKTGRAKKDKVVGYGYRNGEYTPVNGQGRIIDGPMEPEPRRGG